VASTRDPALRVAAEVLAAEDYPALTVERVAGAVGVKPASLYHHFKSGDEMVTEVMITEGRHGLIKAEESLLVRPDLMNAHPVEARGREARDGRMVRSRPGPQLTT
jgi:AcrR family transcriptional regulator